MISNIHTHTNFCDGKDSPEEMVLKALELGFDTIGFSGHSPLDNCKWALRSPEEYHREISRLKKLYADRITVLCGTEQDYYSPSNKFEYDYIIGSVHFVSAGGELYEVDDSREVTLNNINSVFGGDCLKYAKNYYEAAAVCPRVTNADVIGHFDLITKFVGVFDENDKKYRSIALESLEEAAKYDIPFEINTGAIARGYDKIYPAPFLLKRIKELGGSIVITTDCHNRDFLDFAYSDACELAKSCGFDSQVCFVGGKTKLMGLD